MKKIIISLIFIFLNIFFIKNSFACIKDTPIKNIYSESDIVINGKIITKNTIKKVNKDNEGKEYTYNYTTLNIEVIKKLKGFYYKNNISLIQPYFLTTCMGEKYIEIEKIKKGENYIFFINKENNLGERKGNYFHCAMKYSKYLEIKNNDKEKNIYIIITFFLVLLIFYIFIKRN